MRQELVGKMHTSFKKLLLLVLVAVLALSCVPLFMPRSAHADTPVTWDGDATGFELSTLPDTVFTVEVRSTATGTFIIPEKVSAISFVGSDPAGSTAITNVQIAVAKRNSALTLNMTGINITGQNGKPVLLFDTSVGTEQHTLNFDNVSLIDLDAGLSSNVIAASTASLALNATGTVRVTRGDSSSSCIHAGSLITKGNLSVSASAGIGIDIASGDLTLTEGTVTVSTPSGTGIITHSGSLNSMNPFCISTTNRAVCSFLIVMQHLLPFSSSDHARFFSS